jgi:hypothetical protein
MTLELATAAAGALFVFPLILLALRGKSGVEAEVVVRPRNPIGFALESS